MNIFATLPVGDSATWSDDPVSLPDGRMADATAWALTYRLRGPSKLDLQAAAGVGGKTWVTTLSMAGSATLQAGGYTWSATVSTGTERITVGYGVLTMTPDLAAANAGFDGRSKAQIALDNCEAAMATFNNTGGKVKSYDIAGRRMEFQSIADLRGLRDFWAAKVRAEKDKAAVANGIGNPRNLYTRFVRP